MILMVKTGRCVNKLSKHCEKGLITIRNAYVVMHAHLDFKFQYIPVH